MKKSRQVRTAIKITYLSYLIIIVTKIKINIKNTINEFIICNRKLNRKYNNFKDKYFKKIK